MEYYGINVGAWWTDGFMVHSTFTMVYSETLWWSMVDGLNHGFHGMLLTHRWWHASAIVEGLRPLCLAPHRTITTTQYCQGTGWTPY